jgi:molybdopterin molybdotransferase
MALSIQTSRQAAGRTRPVSFDEATQLIAAHAKPLGVETVSIDAADGRILARPATARRAAPATLVSAMDGYAVRDSDLVRLPTALPIAGKSFAGAGFSGPLPAGFCVRIFTGASAPAGTDRIVLQEDVREEDGAAVFATPLSQRRHLRLPGSDFQAGDTIVSAGSVLTPQRLTGVAAANLGEVEVFRQPRVAIICCGDELAEPGSTGQSPDRIPESVSYGIAALVRRWGGTVIARWRRPDQLACLQAAATDAAALADVVVMVGGASVGEKDHAKDAFAPLQMEFLFTRVAIKPGKPVWFGRAGKVLVVGLPGNPSAALVTGRLFLAPLLAGLCGGNAADALDWRMMRSNAPVAGCSDRDVFSRATVMARSAVSLVDQDSASQKTLADATHLIRRRSGDPSSGVDALVETLVL